MPERIPPMTRVAFPGSRLVHAVRRGAARTVCESSLLPDRDRPQPDDEPITCPRCLRLAARETR